MSHDVLTILTKFGLPKTATFEPYSAGGVNVENIYLVSNGGQQYLLKDVRDDHVKQVNYAANLTELLASTGFMKVSKNILSKRSDVVVQSQGKNWELQTFVKGTHIKTENLTEANVSNLATSVAEFHNTHLGKHKPKSIDFDEEIPYMEMFDAEQHKKMVEAVEKLFSEEIPAEDKALLEVYWGNYQKVREEIMASLSSSNVDSLQKSIIHRDLGKGNVLFDKSSGDVAAFVDWDTVMWGNILQDICYLCSHYLVLHTEDSIDSEKTRDLVQQFVNVYQEAIPLNEYEKALFTTLTDILLVRATRWWTKRYLELYTQAKEDSDYAARFEKHRGGFTKTLSNWLNKRESIYSVFSNIDLSN